MPTDYSQPLDDQKAEIYAQEVAKGKSKSDAYRTAYPASASWKQVTVHKRASELGGRGDVVGRVAHLKTQAAELAVFTAADVLKEHLEVLNLNIKDILEEDGSIKPVSAWPDAWGKWVVGMNIAEIWEGRGKDKEQVGTMVKLKMVDKLANLKALGDHISVGAYRSTVALTGPGGGPVQVESKIDFSSMSTAALEELNLAANKSGH